MNYFGPPPPRSPAEQEFGGYFSHGVPENNTPFPAFPGVPQDQGSSTIKNDAQGIADFSPNFENNPQKLTLDILLRQTGLGIKIRFLLALTIIAMFPAIILVLLLGDPTGQEQHAALGRALSIQAQAQANALSQSFSTRIASVARLAKQPTLARAAGKDPVIIGNVNALLHTAQQVDDSSIAWVLVQPDGTILATSNAAQWSAGSKLSQVKGLSQPQQLIGLVQTIAHGSDAGKPLFSNDTHISGGWMAVAYPVQEGASPQVLLATFGLQKMIQADIALSSGLNSSLGVVLDQQGQIIASTAKLGNGQALFTPAPPNVQGVATGSTFSESAIFNDPLTGNTDLGMSSQVKAINGRYILLVSQDTTLAPSTRLFFAGRNTPLLLLAILVIVVLVATWVALPIVRPIRRATRGIGSTTQEVRKLADNARRIAQDQALGTAILSGASRRLSSRRQSIIRDGYTIARTCDALQPRLQWVMQLARGSSNTQLQEALQVVIQGMQQIHRLGTSIASGLENDNTLSQLDGAMNSAHEISAQFEGAGEQLEQGAQQLETAARTLL
ncbi:MAG: hypothetical protein ACJ788_17825 [Ktedonobacteraceae bacterium]